MTVLLDPPEDGVTTQLPPPPVTHPSPAIDPIVEPAVAPAAPAPVPSSGRRLNGLFAIWLVALVLGQGLVVYGFGPMFQDRDQRGLLKEYRLAVEQSAAAGGALVGPDGVVRAPEAGASVGVLEIGGLDLQQVVIEGVGPAQTRRGPGHVPGTAGLGEPGNAVVVGRRTGFGGPFGDLRSLRKGAKIVTTTTQGQAVYTVSSVERTDLVTSLPEGGIPSDGVRLVDDVYGPSETSQLTLVTSARALPWSSGAAVVVVAQMEGKPFPPTLQGTRSTQATGMSSDSTGRAAAILAVLAYGLAMGASVMLYRRLPSRVAYLLTVGPIVAMTIITAETVSRLFPAWM